jgi:hypothetical protein
MEFPNFKEELKKREFTFKCKVARKKVSFYDDAYDNNSHADLVILEPYEGSERDLFMTAYYQEAAPIKNGEGHLTSRVELPAYIGSPCSMPSMVRLSWPNGIYEKPHLLIMTYAMEQLLNSYKSIESIEIKVFPYEKADEFGLHNGVVRI